MPPVNPYSNNDEAPSIPVPTDQTARGGPGRSRTVFNIIGIICILASVFLFFGAAGALAQKITIGILVLLIFIYDWGQALRDFGYNRR